MTLTRSVLAKGPVALALLLLCAGSLVAAPGADSPAGAKPAARPPSATAPTTAPEAAPAAGFVAAADYSAKHSGRAVLVMRGGQVLFERYDNGWSADRPHPLASGTKSFTGVMAMMAVQDGLLTLDELASDTLREWKSDPRKSKITVRHLLTLSSGLDPADAALGSRGGSSVLGEGARQRGERLSRQPGGEGPPPRDLAKAAIAVPTKHDPGTRFDYGPSHFYAVCELLNRKLAAGTQPQKSTMAYLTERVFRPIGIEVARIGRDRAGNPNLPGGAMLTAREWAKFGQFVLRGGSVAGPDGKPLNLLRPELLAECFKPSKANASYGLTWWLLTDPSAGAEADGGGAPAPAGGARDGAAAAEVRDRLRQQEVGPIKGPDGNPLAVYMAAGLGKQRLYVVPAYDLVVVRFAEATTAGRRFDNAEFLGPILAELKGK